MLPSNKPLINPSEIIPDPKNNTEIHRHFNEPEPIPDRLARRPQHPLAQRPHDQIVHGVDPKRYLAEVLAEGAVKGGLERGARVESVDQEQRADAEPEVLVAETLEVRAALFRVGGPP